MFIRSSPAVLCLTLLLAVPPPKLPKGVAALRPETTRKMEELLAPEFAMS